MADSKVNATTNITSLLDKDFFYVGRTDTGIDCYIYASDLISSIQTNVPNHVTCQYNQDTEILLCSAASLSKFKSITLDCCFERDTRSMKEIIQICYNNGIYAIAESNRATIPESETDLGITFALDTTSGLNLIVTIDSVEQNADFYYNVLSRITI